MSEAASNPPPAALKLTQSAQTPLQRVKEGIIEAMLFVAGISSIIITLGIVAVLLGETIPFFTTAETKSIYTPSVEGAEELTVSKIVAPPGQWIGKGDPIVEFTSPGGPAVLRATASGTVLKILHKVGDSVTMNSHLVDISHRVSLMDFFGDTLWAPVFDDPRYGIWSLISGTMVTTLVALSLAIPVGTIIAIWLSEYCYPGAREVLKPALELLAAVPTVVYGYFALLVVSPLMQHVLRQFGIEMGGFNMLSAGLVMGVMIIPYVASLSEDAMRAVPMPMREGSYAMGATRLQTALRVLLPAALSGITAAYILAIARAIGETMIVALAAGQMPNFTLDPTQEAATISAAIVQATLGDLPHDSTAYRAIFAAGLVLMAMTLFFNIAGYLIRRRYREAY
ncbi:MAG TPA: phosphate ABC transporter permease subunit PstC [Tepidisphaeraceae bacterium]|jgi:phosphate transport system permease protein